MSYPLRCLCVAAMLVVFRPLPDALASQTGQTYALPPVDSLVQEAVAHNPSLHAARLEPDIQRAKSAAVRPWPDPWLRSTVQPVPIVTARGAQRTVWEIEQTVPFPGKHSLRARSFEYAAEASAELVRSAEQDLARQIRFDYYELFGIQERRRLILSYGQRLATFEEATLSYFESARESQRAVLNVQLERRRQTLRLDHLDEHAVQLRQRLARLLDRPDDAGLLGHIAEDEVYARLVALTTARISGDPSLETHPDIAAAHAGEAQQQTAVDLARRAFYPDLTFSLTYFDIAEKSLTETMTGRDALGIRVGLRLPLQRRRLNERLEQARLEHRQAAARTDGIATQVRTEARDASGRVTELIEQLDQLENDLIPLAESNVQAATVAYRNTRIDFPDLLDSERTLHELTMERIETIVRLLHAHADYLHAVASPLP